MKKYMLLLAFAVLIPSIVVTQPVSAADYINQADIDISNQTFKAVDNFTNELSNGTPETIAAETVTVDQALRNFINHSFSNDLGDTYSKKAEEAKSIAREIQADIQDIDTILASEDPTEQDAFLDKYNQHIDNFNQKITEVNDAVDTSNNTAGNSYLVYAIIASVLAVGSFVWAFARPDKRSDLAASQKKVAFASLAPLAGTVITYITFLLAAKQGGSYFIAWGLILFGLAVYGRSILEYFKLRKQPVTAVK